MILIKQTVYLPVKPNEETFSVLDEGRLINKVVEVERIVFTPEQLNQLLSNVIKYTLYQATQFVELQYECGKKSKEGCVAVFCNNCHEQVDKESITNTFEETFKRFKYE